MARVLERRKRHAEESHMSEKVLSRLRWYLTALESFQSEGVGSVSSWQLAERVGVNAALIRKDLSKFGEFGTPSSGYRIDYLYDRIKDILHLGVRRSIVWVGACTFAKQEPRLNRLERQGMHVAAVFDSDAGEIGKHIGDYEVQPVSAMESVLASVRPCIAVISLSGSEAQQAAEIAARHGVKAVLNLSGALLLLPKRVRVCSIDILGEIIELCYYCDV
jgi:redox-sensing transcriptional repressor